MNHLAAVLNVMSMVDIEKDLQKHLFEQYLSDFFQLLEEGKVSESDYETMQEIAHAIGLNENEFHEIMEEDSKKEDKSEEEHDFDEHEDHESDDTQLTQYINTWINPDSDPRFLF